MAGDEVVVRDVCEALNCLAPPDLAFDWDRPGLSTGSLEAPVDTVLVCLSVTKAAVRAACKTGAQLVVAHHPLIFKPLSSLRDDDPASSLCLELVRERIACYAAHTNLDVVPGGVNDVIARKLELVDTCPLFPTTQARHIKLITFIPESCLAPVRRAVCEAGAGQIGAYRFCTFSSSGTGTFYPEDSATPAVGKKMTLNEEMERRFEVIVPRDRLRAVLGALEESHPYEEVAYDLVPLENTDPRIGLGMRGKVDGRPGLDDFAAQVRDKLELPHLRLVGNPRKKVTTVAVLGGSGGDDIGAVPADIDVYISGDIKYHHALTAQEKGLAVIDAGHVGLEKWIVPALAQYLQDRFAKLRTVEHPEADPFRSIG